MFQHLQVKHEILQVNPYLSVQGEAVVDPSRQDEQVAWRHLNPDPAVFLIPDVKVTWAFCDEPDLLVSVQVLLKEHLDLGVYKYTYKYTRSGGRNKGMQVYNVKDSIYA